MNREYTVQNWQGWETDEGPVRDVHGNYKGTVWFEEDPRQADATFKTQPEKGDKKYGDLADYTTKAGKTRLGFKRADRPEEGQQAFGGDANAPKREWVDHSDAIRAQWAIGQAVQINTDGNQSAIEACAKQLYAMVDRVKGADSLKAEAPNKGAKDDDDLDAEAESLYKSIAGAEEIPLAEIPF